MRIILIIFLLMCLFLVKLSGQPKITGKKFILNGIIHGKYNGKVVISYPAAPNYLIVNDTADVVESKFQFTGLIREPCSASLRGHVTSNSVDDSNFTDIYIEPGVMKVVLTANQFKNVQVVGSNTQRFVERLNRQLQPVTYKLNETYYQRQQLEKQKEALKANDEIEHLDNKIRIIDSSREKLYAARDSIRLAFIKTNPTCWYSSDLLYEYIEKLPIDTLYSLFNRLATPIQNGLWGNRLKRDLVKMKNSSPGNTAPDFKVKDVNGNTVSLSSINKDKYVLLDFWASWCVPCRQDFSNLKKTYNEYHPKGLEIIAISQDIDKSKWKAAIEKDSIGMWWNCPIAEDLNRTFAGYPNENDIYEQYYIQSIPVKILINKEGIIIGRWPSRNGKAQPSLEEVLTSQFKRKKFNSLY